MITIMILRFPLISRDSQIGGSNVSLHQIPAFLVFSQGWGGVGRVMWSMACRGGISRKIQASHFNEERRGQGSVPNVRLIQTGREIDRFSSPVCHFI